MTSPRTKEPVIVSFRPLRTRPAGEQNEPLELKVNAFRIGFTGAIGVLLAIMLGGMVTQLGTVFVYVSLALFLALGLDPAVSWLQRRNLKRPVAILIVFGAAVGVFVALIATVVPVLIQSVEDWPKIVEGVRDSELVRWASGLGGDHAIRDTLETAGQMLADPKTLTSIGGGIFSIGAGIAGGFTGAIIVLILTLYFLASIDQMKRYAARFVPASARTTYLEVTEEVTGAVGRYVAGQVSLAVIGGIAALAFLSMIGAPEPVLLAAIFAVCALIPLVGTITGAGIATVVCLFASPATAIAAGVFFLVYAQVDAYLLSPKIMGKAVAVPGAVVVVAAVAGGTLGGILGALVAIPVAASLIIVAEKVVLPRQEGR
ncbi:AI-2E family transporter [Agromyces sp. NPDC057679]|uniref:AI-2E family transporter n=1 Tax=Agromyces sp. NPDC057679 TaxID=3346207 RepID=UPI00366CDB59